MHFLLTAGKYSGENFEWQVFGRKGNDVHRRQWLSAHRIDVGQRIRGGDLAEVERIVDDGREEVHRLHEGEIIGDTKDPGVVEGLSADEQAWIFLYGERGQRAG